MLLSANIQHRNYNLSYRLTLIITLHVIRIMRIMQRYYREYTCALCLLPCRRYSMHLTTGRAWVWRVHRSLRLHLAHRSSILPTRCDVNDPIYFSLKERLITTVPFVWTTYRPEAWFYSPNSIGNNIVLLQTPLEIFVRGATFIYIPRVKKKRVDYKFAFKNSPIF